MTGGTSTSSPRIAIVGKGALGLMYAGIIQDTLGDDAVFFVMDEERLARHAGETYSINGTPREFRTITPGEAGPVDLVLVAVKATVLEEALELVPPLLGPATVIAPVLIIYFMLSGIFTPGETGAMACIYIIAVALFHRSFSFKKLWNASMETLKSCGTMMIMSVTGTLFTTVMTLEKVPQKLITVLGPVAENKIAVLILINLVLLVLGMLMESNAAMFMIAPIILAITTPLGIDPLQMGVIIVFNLMIGLSTPPYGLCIFTVAKVGRVDPGSVIKEVMPMWVPMLITLLCVTFIPAVTMWLPNLLFG